MKARNLIAEQQEQKTSANLRIRINFLFHLFPRSIAKFFVFLLFCIVINFYSTFAAAPKIAVVAPEKTLGHSEKFAAELARSLAGKAKVLDNSLSETAFRAALGAEKPFNLPINAAKTIGAAIGCEYLVLVKSSNQRRSTFEKKDFYESFAAVYVVSARTGQLVFWKLQIFEADREMAAEKLLFASTDALASEILSKSSAATAAETSTAAEKKIEEVPPENAPEAKNFRPPLPFKRFKPEYTRLAYIYDVTATIDVSVDVAADGEITRVRIERWAGFGLDEAVIETVRQMNWRPAERNGKPLPMRVLLRYNFKRIEKEEN